MLVDSHCHLEYKGLVEDQDAALDRAREGGAVAATSAAEERCWRQIEYFQSMAGL